MTDATDFVIDAGNARIKWARALEGRLSNQGAALHAGRLEQALHELAAAVPSRPRRVLVANVATESVAAGVRDVVHKVTGRMPLFARTTTEALGVRCAYDDPERLGVDRWVALLAARAMVDGPVCVISAGTAVTFDALDDGGQHLGGLIFAGPRLCAEALLNGTRYIGPTSGRASAPSDRQLLGRSTEEGVSHAGLLGVAAGLDRAVATVNRMVAGPPQVLLCGGDAAELHGWLETAVEIRADLVLEGLALLAEQG